MTEVIDGYGKGIVVETGIDTIVGCMGTKLGRDIDCFASDIKTEIYSKAYLASIWVTFASFAILLICGFTVGSNITLVLLFFFTIVINIGDIF